MLYTPLAPSEVYNDLRIIHLLNEDLIQPLLFQHGFQRRTLKAHLLPLVDSQPVFHVGRHFYEPMTKGIEVAFCYNNNLKGVDTVDVFAVSRKTDSKRHLLWRRLMYSYLLLRDHPFRSPLPRIKHASVYDDYFRQIFRFLIDMDVYFVDDSVKTKVKKDLEQLHQYIEVNVALVDNSQVAYPNQTVFEKVLSMLHRILLEAYPPAT